MKRIRYLLYVFISVLMFPTSGCNNDNLKDYSVSLDFLEIKEIETDGILFEGNQLERSMFINSSKEWTINIDYHSENKEWLSVVPNSGKGGECVQIEAKDFYTTIQETRKAKIRLTCGDITQQIEICQKSFEMKIDVSRELLPLNNGGGGKEVLYINSNIEWESTYEEFDSYGVENWYKTVGNKKEGFQGHDSLQIVPTGANNTFSVRSSILFIYPKRFELKDSSDYPTLFKKVLIRQEKKPDLYWDIPSDPKNKTVYFNSTGGEREVLIYSNVRWRKPENTKQFTFELEEDAINPRLKILKIEAIKNDVQTELQEDAWIVILDEEDKKATPEEPIHISQEPAIP